MDHGRKSVLLVEDSPSLSESISMLLRKGGFEVDVVRDASDAIDHLKKLGPAVVVTDLDLPWGNGIAINAFIKRMTASENCDWTPPVIVISGRSGGDWRRHAVIEGAFAALPKPFDPEELLGAVRGAAEATAQPPKTAAPGRGARK